MTLRRWLFGGIAGGLLLLGSIMAVPLVSAQDATPPSVSTPSSGGSTQNGSGNQTTPKTDHVCDHANGG